MFFYLSKLIVLQGYVFVTFEVHFVQPKYIVTPRNLML